MQSATRTEQYFPYPAGLVFNAALAVIKRLGFSSITYDRRALRLAGAYTKSLEGQAIVIQIEPQPVVSGRCRLVLDSTPTNDIGAATPVSIAADGAEIRPDERVLRAIGMYMDGVPLDVIARRSPLPKTSKCGCVAIGFVLGIVVVMLLLMLISRDIP